MSPTGGVLYATLTMCRTADGRVLGLPADHEIHASRRWNPGCVVRRVDHVGVRRAVSVSSPRSGRSVQGPAATERVKQTGRPASANEGTPGRRCRRQVSSRPRILLSPPLAYTLAGHSLSLPLLGATRKREEGAPRRSATGSPCSACRCTRTADYRSPPLRSRPPRPAKNIHLRPFPSELPEAAPGAPNMWRGRVADQAGLRTLVPQSSDDITDPW